MANGAIDTDDSAWCTLNLETVSLLEKHRLHSLRADRRRPLESRAANLVWRLTAGDRSPYKVKDMLP